MVSGLSYPCQNKDQQADFLVGAKIRIKGFTLYVMTITYKPAEQYAFLIKDKQSDKA